MSNEIGLFKDLNSANIASFWTTQQLEQAPYLGEILFPATKQSTRLIEWYKGQTEAPKPQRPSAYGVQAIPETRQGLESVQTSTTFFKSSKYIDEDLAAQLADLGGSNDPARYRLVISNIMNDSAKQLANASLTREIIRMQMLLTGKYSFTGNGATAEDDYQMKSTHQGLAKGASWQESGSDPAYDIQNAIDIIGNDQGTTVNRLYMNTHTFRALLSNNQVKSTLLANNANTAAVSLRRQDLLDYVLDEYGVNITIYDKFYQATSGLVRFIPDGKIIFAPEGQLGRTVFAPTPEERGLRMRAGVDVSLVDTAVAITAEQIIDPVTVNTKVTQEFAPTYERIDDVFIFDAFNTAPKA